MRSRHLFSLALAVALTAFSFSSVTAQDITADELLDNYFETIGGKDAWKNISSMRMSGITNAQGMSFPVTVTSMEPNLQKVEVSVQEKMLIDAFDGENAWGINPFMGGTEPQLKTDEESEQAAKNDFENELIDYAAKGHQVVIEGTEEIDGLETIKLKLTRKEGDEHYYFFDPETYVPIMMRSFVEMGPQKGMAVEVYMSDYDDVDGLIIAHTIEQKMNGQTVMQMTAERVELNPEDISKEDFAYPGK
jgi:hypothetical protein